MELVNLDIQFPSLVSRDKEDSKLEIRHDDITCSVWVCFCDIYQDCCYDPLVKVPDPGDREGLEGQPPLSRHEAQGPTIIR